jgi:hypothetical protein
MGLRIHVRIDAFRARLATVFNRPNNATENPPVVPTGAMNWPFNIGRIGSRYALLLAIVLMSFGCLVIMGPAFISAMYPLELEPREGTNWLHALALSRGTNIFDPATVAYINMNHGPMDAIVKSLFISIFPTASASLITRSFCVLLPLIIFAASLFLLRHKVFPMAKALILTFIIYGLIVINPTYGSFVGRSDPTALCFGFLAAAVMLSSVDVVRPRFYEFGLVGLLLSLMVLTNWRFFVVVPFMLVAWWRYDRLILRQKLSTYFICLLGLLLPPLFVLYRYYSWDIGLYYKHYFGFFGSASGWLPRSTSDRIDAIYDAAWALFHPNWRNGYYLLWGSALLAVIAIGTNGRRGIAVQWPFWVILLVAAVFVHYLIAAINYGTVYYMKPVLIVAWMFGIILSARVDTIRFPTVGAISIAIVVVIVGRHVASQYLFFARSFPKAFEYARAVQLAELEAPVYTESHFFFLRSRIPMVDMGDTASVVEKTGYYGPDFSRTFRENLNRLTHVPPAYIVHSFVDSPELAAIVRMQYSERQCAPHYYVDYSPPCLFQRSVRNQ